MLPRPLRGPAAGHTRSTPRRKALSVLACSLALALPAAASTALAGAAATLGELSTFSSLVKRAKLVVE